MYRCRVKKFEDFSIFLASNNWLLLLKKVEKKFLMLNKVVELRQKIDEKEPAKVTKRLLVRKYEFEVDYTNTQVAGHQCKRIPNWTVF